jgi:hypothetical protein
MTVSDPQFEELNQIMLFRGCNANCHPEVLRRNYCLVLQNKKSGATNTGFSLSIYLILNQRLLRKQRIAAHHLCNIRFDLR